jgi:hypothetical protein
MLSNLYILMLNLISISYGGSLIKSLLIYCVPEINRMHHLIERNESKLILKFAFFYSNKILKLKIRMYGGSNYKEGVKYHTFWTYKGQ